MLINSARLLETKSNVRDQSRLVPVPRAGTRHCLCCPALRTPPAFCSNTSCVASSNRFTKSPTAIHSPHSGAECAAGCAMSAAVFDGACSGDPFSAELDRYVLLDFYRSCFEQRTPSREKTIPTWDQLFDSLNGTVRSALSCNKHPNAASLRKAATAATKTKRDRRNIREAVAAFTQRAKARHTFPMKEGESVFTYGLRARTHAHDEDSSSVAPESLSEPAPQRAGPAPASSQLRKEVKRRRETEVLLQKDGVSRRKQRPPRRLASERKPKSCCSENDNREE